MDLTSRVTRFAAAAVIGLSALVGGCSDDKDDKARVKRVNDDVHITSAWFTNSCGVGSIMLTGVDTTGGNPEQREVALCHKTPDKYNQDIKPEDFVNNTYRIEAVKTGEPSRVGPFPLYNVVSLTATRTFPNTITVNDPQFTWYGRPMQMVHALCREQDKGLYSITFEGSTFFVCSHKDIPKESNVITASRNVSFTAEKAGYTGPRGHPVYRVVNKS